MLDNLRTADALGGLVDTLKATQISLNGLDLMLPDCLF
jgi:hypothetical protein